MTTVEELQAQVKTLTATVNQQNAKIALHERAFYAAISNPKFLPLLPKIMSGQVVQFTAGFLYVEQSPAKIKWEQNGHTTQHHAWNPVNNQEDREIARQITQVEVNAQMNANDLKILCVYLLFCPNITTLNLNFSKIGDAGVELLSAVFPFLNNLTVLYCQDIGLKKKGVFLCDALPSLPQLERLSLPNNNLGPGEFVAVASRLARLKNQGDLPNLKSVGLHGNEEGEAARRGPAAEELRKVVTVD